MAKLRLFANLREMAGVSRLEMPAGTVAELIEGVASRFGDDFRQAAATARVWVNGETVAPDHPLGDDDEVVLIPPVSGGDRPVSSATTLDLMSLLPAGVGLVAVLAVLQGQPIWAATLVAIVAVWGVDLSAVFLARGRVFAPLAVAAVAGGSALSAHVLGGAGYALALAVTVVVGLGWAVAFPVYRRVDVFSPVVMTSLFGGLGVASLVLARSAHSPESGAANVFLTAMIVAVVLGMVVERFPTLPLVDPFSASAIGAVLTAVGAAALWDLDVVGYLLVGVGLAVALVAGRGFSSILRSGQVILTERPGGLLAPLDGVVLAAAVYYPLLTLVF